MSEPTWKIHAQVRKMPVQLDSHWSIIYIISCLAAFAGFAAAFAACVGYILQGRMLKAKRMSVFQQFLPALDRADRLAYRMAAFGFLMLTLGIVVGSLWSQSAKGICWNWDPKETWSLITWLIYAAYLHVRVVSGWRGKWTNCLLITGFTCVLVMVFGTGFLSLV